MQKKIQKITYFYNLKIYNLILFCILKDHENVL